MTGLTTTYGTQLAPMPTFDLPIVNGVDLVRCLRSYQLNHLNVGIATGEQVIPFATFKYDGTGGQLAFSCTYTESKPARLAVEAMIDKPTSWPYPQMIGRYIWLNSKGQTLAPPFGCSANIIEEPNKAVCEMLYHWAGMPVGKIISIVWVGDKPFRVFLGHLPMLMLATLPTAEYYRALELFDDLGQSFARFYLNWSGLSGNTVAEQINRRLLAIPRFGVVSSMEVMSQLRKLAR